MHTEFEAGSIKIRPLRTSDASSINDNIRDDEVTRWTMHLPHPFPRDGAGKFIRRSRYNWKKQKGYAFGIVSKNTGEVIGVVELMRLDWDNKNAELGYWLGKKYWGHGIMAEAIELVLRFGFEVLNLHRVYARLFAANPGSAAVLEKTGFTLEGSMREEQHRYGRWHDVLWYGILRSEFQGSGVIP